MRIFSTEGCGSLLFLLLGRAGSVGGGGEGGFFRTVLTILGRIHVGSDDPLLTNRGSIHAQPRSKWKSERGKCKAVPGTIIQYMQLLRRGHEAH